MFRTTPVTEPTHDVLVPSDGPIPITHASRSC
jgi:hypothetical protein